MSPELLEVLRMHGAEWILADPDGEFDPEAISDDQVVMALAGTLLPLPELLAHASGMLAALEQGFRGVRFDELTISQAEVADLTESVAVATLGLRLRVAELGGSEE